MKSIKTLLISIITICLSSLAHAELNINKVITSVEGSGKYITVRTSFYNVDADNVTEIFRMGIDGNLENGDFHALRFDERSFRIPKEYSFESQPGRFFFADFSVNSGAFRNLYNYLDTKNQANIEAACNYMNNSEVIDKILKTKSINNAHGPFLANQKTKKSLSYLLDLCVKTSAKVHVTDEQSSLTELGYAVEKVDKDVNVAKVQAMLAELCYEPGIVDGAWGKKTETAVKAFFAKHYRKYDGNFDVKDANFILSAGASTKAFGSENIKKCLVVYGDRIGDNLKNAKIKQITQKVSNKKKSSNKYLRNFIESKSNPWELALNKSFKNTKPSPLEQIYIKAHTLSKRAYEISFSNPYSNILEVKAASGQKTKEFKFQGYDNNEIKEVRELLKKEKKNTKALRKQNLELIKNNIKIKTVHADGKYWNKHKYIKANVYDDQEIISKEIEKSHRIIYVADTIEIPKGRTLDGKNKIFVWVGAYNCSQDEGMPPMFGLQEDSHIKNLFMIEAPDGIHFYGNNSSADKIVNLNVCEDAMTGKTDIEPKLKNISITNSIFYNGADKCLQVDRIRSGLIVIGNKFINCKQPILINKFIKDFIARDNKIVGQTFPHYRLMHYNVYW
jgi:hypothetical protein